MKRLFAEEILNGVGLLLEAVLDDGRREVLSVGRNRQQGVSHLPADRADELAPVRVQSL